MSGLPPKTPNELVSAASDVRDLADKAANSPELQSALSQIVSAFVTNRSLLGTKTFWVTLITPLVAAIVTHYGLGLSDATVGEISAGAVTLAAWVMRYVSTTPVATVLPKAS